MAAITDRYRPLVFSIATPHSAGTGFYVPEHGLVVTNEHLVRDDESAVIAAPGIPEQSAAVVYIDPFYDLAFLRPAAALPVAIDLPVGPEPTEHAAVISLSHPFGFAFQTTAGHIIGSEAHDNGTTLLRHSTALLPEHSGGPLFDTAGRLVGVNTVLLDEAGNRGLSLPADYLMAALAEFRSLDGTEAVRCANCATLYGGPPRPRCTNCGHPLPPYPSTIDAYCPEGIGVAVEALLEAVGYDPTLSRRGPDHWAVRRGSALIELAYYEKNGFLTGDATLCELTPNHDPSDLFAYLLSENFTLDGLVFSLRENRVLLSFMIYDRYLHTETGRQLFDRLFERADHYDDVLVDTYGARWMEQ